MIRILKKNFSILLTLIRAIFLKFGYNIINQGDRNSLDGIFKFIYNDNENDLHNFEVEPRKNINKKIIIFDVGANKGQSIRRFKSIAPNCKIFSYEPTNGYFEILKKNFLSKDIFLINKAIGSRLEKKMINIYPHGASSFLKINLSVPSIKKRYKVWKMKSLDLLKKQIISVTTIDKEFKILKLKKINILKIDIQGFEIECLKGASRSLRNSLIDFVQLEIIFSDSYHKNQSNLSNIDQIFRKYQYTLISIIPKGSNLLNNCEYSGELLYCNKFMLKNIKNFHKLAGYRQFV